MTSTSVDTPHGSPWLSVWFRPRATISRIVAANPRRRVWLLASLGMICAIVGQLLLAGSETELLDWRMIAGIVLGGVIVGIIGLYCSGFFYWLSGRLFGGHASSTELRAAIAWSELPIVLGTTICLALLAGLTLSGGRLDPNLLTVILSFLVGATGLWALILRWFMLARIQHFGFWRTVGSVVVALLIAFVAVALLLVLPFRTFAFQPFNIPSGSMTPTLQVGDHLFVAKYPYGYTRYSLPFSPALFSGRIFGAEPRRGDVVVYRLPKDNTVSYISRVVGLPGDRIQMVGGELRINGVPVKRERIEDFVMEQNGRSVPVKRWRETLPNGVSHETLDLQDNGFFDNTPEYQVPAGHYFMMGDNRDNATDSRVLSAVGYVPFDHIVGRAAMIFYSKAPTSGHGASADPFRRFGTMVR